MEVGVELAELLPWTVIMPQNLAFNGTEAYFGCRLQTLAHRNDGWKAHYIITLFVNFYVTSPLVKVFFNLNTFRMTQFDAWRMDRSRTYEEARFRLIELYLGKAATRYTREQALVCFDGAFSPALEIVRDYYIQHILSEKILKNEELKEQITDLIQVTMIHKKRKYTRTVYY